MLGILLAATVAASPAAPPALHPLACPAVRQQKTADRGSVGPRKLGDLPDGRLYHAIWKEAAGCAIDEVWREGRWVDVWAGTGRPVLRNAGERDR